MLITMTSCGKSDNSLTQPTNDEPSTTITTPSDDNPTTTTEEVDEIANMTLTIKIGNTLVDVFCLDNESYFQTPKPVKLIKELIRATTSKDSIVLDFFAGSGTAGQAVVELNKENGENRKYILVSNNESNICKNVTLKRIMKFDKNIVFID